MFYFLLSQVVEDFAAKYPNTQCKLIHFWEIVNTELFKIYKNDIIDPGHKKIIEEYSVAPDLDEGNF